MTTVAIYASASGLRAELSIAAQIDSCRRFAARLGHPAPEVFVDRDGEMIAETKGGLALCASCVVGKTDTIIVASRFRLGRTPEMVDRALEWAAEEGIAVRFVDVELDLLPEPV